jgi:hypothetical protein
MKKRTIYKVVTENGEVVGIAGSKRDALWVKKQYLKEKLKIIKSSTTLPYGSPKYWKLKKVL